MTDTNMAAPVVVFPIYPAVGIAVTVLVLACTFHYGGGSAFISENKDLIYDVHTVLMVIGLVLLNGEVYKTVSGTTGFRKLLHQTLQFIAFSFSIIGLWAAWKFHIDKGINNFYCLQLWLGLACLCLFSIQLYAGYETYSYPGGSRSSRAGLLPWHVYFGVYICGLAIVTSTTGIFEKATFSPPQPLPSPPSQSPTTQPESGSSQPFLFPKADSNVLPDPSSFFSPNLLSNPLPTNSFFQNFVLKNGDQPEYIHPYLIKSAASTLTICYPPQSHSSKFIAQVFIPDLSISVLTNLKTNTKHIISSFSDLSITLDHPSSNLRFFLVRGSPFLTCNVMSKAELSISTIHAILEFRSNAAGTKYTIKLNNNQTWLLYSSSPVNLTNDISTVTSSSFTGVIRIALLPDPDPKCEMILDRFSSCYPVAGDALFSRPFYVEYRWEKRGWGDLLMLAHPLHRHLLSNTDSPVTILEELKYESIDGLLVGVVGDWWVLKSVQIPVDWHSTRGLNEESYDEVINALIKDVNDLNSAAIPTSSSYFYGKLIARAARFALIAEEACYLEVVPAVRKFLKDTIEPWLDGTFGANGFFYDSKWGGLVTKQGSSDSGADFGFGIYNDHHYHLGYFIYAISVLAKIDPVWGMKYRSHAYSLMEDFMTLNRRPDSNYTRLRNFDPWKLHSWAGGLTEFADGRNQESTSEAVNAYYSAALMGLAYGDTHLVAIGSTLSALEIQAAQTWWHVREDDNIYAEDFTAANRIVGMVWANKRDSGLWFAPPEWKECRLGIQELPLLPITEVLFSDVNYTRDLVKWTLPALNRDGVGEGWKGFVYALEGIYDRESALKKIRNLKGYDDGDSLTNLLWWIHSRGVAADEEQGKLGKLCSYRHNYE